MFAVGTKVELLHDVDRYPHFVAPGNTRGEVTHNDGETLCVKLDDLVVGAEDWDNEVVWSMFDGDVPSDDIKAI